MRSTHLVLALFAAAVVSATPAWSINCEDVDPFINEFDYDSDDGFPNDDRDEFVEVAAPIGADLTGLRLVVVEGNEGGLFGLPCSTGLPKVGNGNSHFEYTLPAGSIVPDPDPLDPNDTMGVLVVCFDVTSGNVIASGRCDVIADSPFNDSTLKNGHLTNGNDWECPDGILLLDGGNGLLDAVSYEGVVPNSGAYGAHFNAPNPSYRTPRDDGFGNGESIYKTTGVPARATGATEWSVSPNGQASPGELNPGQFLTCDANVDTDGDTVLDVDDNCPLTPNAGQEDADGDGVGDVCDNCPDDANPGQEDDDGFEDGDGIGDACECNPNPGPGHWEIEYDLAGTEFETRNTPFGAGDGTHVVGPGTATIRFDADGNGPGGNLVDGGSAQFVQLELAQEFTVNTSVLGFTANVITDLDSDIPDNTWDGNPAGIVSPGSSTGTISGVNMTLVTPPGLADYHTQGTVLCNGNGCDLGGLPDGVPTVVNDTIDLTNFTTVTFGAGGPATGAGWDGNEIALPPQEAADPFLRLKGTELTRTFVPGTPAQQCEADADGDGFPDGSDNCPGTPNDQSDVNGDGIGDACQPNDTDSDGWPDVEDNCPNDANADQSDVNSDGIGDVCQPNDPDGDGLPDAEDNCPGIPNLDQNDINGDGIGDLCQTDDPDADFWPSSQDNCPTTPNTDQTDADGDGVGDVCDNCPAVSNAGQGDVNGNGVGDACEPSDADGDGWPNAEDNCPGTSNVDQSDVNGDGTGDACEPADADGDGWPDAEDNCAATSNVDQFDVDGDGVGDACDNCVTISNADQADDDTDGIGNACEGGPSSAVPALPIWGVPLLVAMLTSLGIRGSRRRS